VIRFGDRAVRIGTALSPADDIRAFERKRRREVLKTTAVVCGVALGLGAIGLPFFLKKGNPPAELLLSPEIAKADPEVVRQLCLLYYRHPEEEIRAVCALALRGFADGEATRALWALVEEDRSARVRRDAMTAVLHRNRAEDYPRIAARYAADAEVRGTIDQFIAILELTELDQRIRAR